MIVRGGDGCTILPAVGYVEISILDLPYAQALLFAALDLLAAVESGEWDRVVESRWRLRAILDAHSVPLND